MLQRRYGAPRRNAQERLRSLVTASEQEAEDRERDLHELVELLGQTPGELPSGLSRPVMPASARRRGERTAAAARVPTLSECVRRCIFRLQLKLHRRGMFLQQLRENARTGLHMELAEADFVDDPLARSSDTAEDEASAVAVGRSEEDESLIPAADRASFMHAVMVACTNCETETKKLYEREGKDAQVPESLQTWLKEQRHWAKEQRLQAAADFKRQVQWFRQLLPRLADLAMVDVTARVRARMARRSGKLSRSLDRRLRLWEAAKAQHKTALKPRLASVNQAEELAALVEKEAARSAEVLQAVSQTEVKVVVELRECAALFKRLIVHNATSLVGLLDRCLDQDDVKPLRLEDVDILSIERGYGLPEGSTESNAALQEVVQLTGPNGAVTLRERPLDELQPGVPGTLLRPGGGLKAGGSSGVFEEGQQVEVKLQLSSRRGQPCYSAGDRVTVHNADEVSSIPRRFAGAKSEATTFFVTQHDAATGLVQIKAGGSEESTSPKGGSHPSPSSAQTVASVGPFTVPEQLVCGPDDLFIPGVVVAREVVHGSSDKINGGLRYKYSIEFEKAHSSLRRLRRKERRVGRDGEIDPHEVSSDSDARMRRQRVWPGLDLAKLSLPADAVELLRQLDEEAEAAKAAAEEEAAKAAKKSGSKGKKGASKAKPSPNGADTDAGRDDTTSPEVAMLLLPPQRAAMRARDRCFGEFVVQFADILNSCRQQYADLVDEEHAWVENWGNMVKILKNSGGGQEPLDETSDEK